MSKSDTDTFMNEKGILHYKAGELDKAIICWEKAANLGNSSAMFGLGVIYLNDNSIENNLYKAEEWFKKAASFGHKNAIIQLNKIKKLKTESNDKNLETNLKKENDSYKNKNNVNKSYNKSLNTIKFGNYEWIIIEQKKDNILDYWF